MNEKELAQRLSCGDEKALGQLIDEYSCYVRTVAYNFSRGRLTDEDIDDITAEVFCRIWEARGNINADIGIRAYLSAAARNLLKNRFKREPPRGDDISELEIADDFRVETLAELHEMTACMYEGLKKLPPKDRKIFFRYYYYGESASQIAKELGTQENAVFTRLCRVRKKLRNYLNERGYFYV